MGRLATDRTLRKGSPETNTHPKKRKLADCITDSAHAVVFAAVSFASPEKTDKCDLESNAVIVRTEVPQDALGNDGEKCRKGIDEVEVTERPYGSSLATENRPLPGSTFIPNSPHPEFVEISTLTDKVSPSDDACPSPCHKNYDIPSRVLALQPRKGNDTETETVPSLCSSTSGLQSESSPDSQNNYLLSQDPMISKAETSDSGGHSLTKSNMSPMKVSISSPKAKDESKTSYRSDRNVTFSPVPPVKYHYFDDGHVRIQTKQNAEQTTALAAPNATPAMLPDCMTSDGELRVVTKTDLDEDENKNHREYHRDGGITPTNFAFDFGKVELTSSFDGSNALSWLQTPTGNMFSPGGLAVSTPLMNVLFFPDAPAHIPSPRHPVAGDMKIAKETMRPENHSIHTFNNAICVSPLASSKNQLHALGHPDKVPGCLHSINFKEVFASPKMYHEATIGDAKYSRTAGNRDINQERGDIDLDFDIAERDIMEDEDLNLLRNLAQSTPQQITMEERSSHPSAKFGGKGSVFRGSPRLREKVPSWKNPPLSLQMPLIPLESHNSSELLQSSKKSTASSRKSKKQVLADTVGSSAAETRMTSLNHGSSPGRSSMVAGAYYPPTFAKPNGMPTHVHGPYSHHMGMPPPQYRYPYPHPHHTYGLYQKQSAAAVSSRNNSGGEIGLKGEIKHEIEERSSTSKVVKKVSSKMGNNHSLPSKKAKTSSNQATVTERPKSAAIISATVSALETSNGSKLDKAAALAAAIMRGVTMRPSGKWQAQLYYAGKSRYIGVFDTREKAALAYEIARDQLKTDKPIEPGSISLKETEANVNAARQAAFHGVSEADSKTV